MTREEVRKLIETDPELVVEFILRLEERITQLENQLAKDSHNSSKPPSSDGLRRKKRTQSLRRKSGNKTGGQKGHQGSTLKMVENPDCTIPHKVEGHCDCGCSLKDKSPLKYEKRQVFDLPLLKIEVTEHSAEVKQCQCGRIHVADFPLGVNSPTQYGTRIKAFISYLMVYQHIPYERTSELIDDLLNHKISQGTLYNIYRSCYHGLEMSDEFIKEQVIQSDVAHFDETGSSVNKKNRWLHVASTSEFTYYACHEKRGQEAMDAIGILPEFKGTAIHDFWKSYLKYDCDHGLCNAHHLRNLNYIFEQYEQSWAQNMITLLIEIKETVDRTKIHQNCLDKDISHGFENKYHKILMSGYEANPPPDKKTEKPKRGRPKRSEPVRLLDRFKDHSRKVLAFMYDFNIPFDNNLAERDLRMMKLHLKISGNFRCEKGADMFCRVRSYISSVKKHNLNVLDSLTQVFLGQPVFGAE